MPSPFVKELKQFALTVDIVNEAVLRQVGDLLKQYFLFSLKANAYEVRVSAASGTLGERYLHTLYSHNDRRFTAPLYKEGLIRGHTSYAVLKDKPLWIIAKDRGVLRSDGEYIDLWSKVEDLPQYREWPDSQQRTSIIIPLSSPPIGFLNLEFNDLFEPISSSKQELLEIAESIAILCQLCETNRVRLSNTEKAVGNIIATAPRNPLFKPTLFLAFSSQADQEVVGVIKDVLASYSEFVKVVSWDEMHNAGNIHAQMREAILTAEYGVCYFSQPSKTDSAFVDNPNVIFEAGMFHAITSSEGGESRWIPIREEYSGAPPFDFAADRLLNICRNKDGTLNVQSLRSSISKRLEALLKI